MKRILAFWFVLTFVLSLYAQQRPKNIVILIGDGMGVTQITGGWIYKRGTLPLRRFTDVGLMTVHPIDALITDSAAGATAFACGKKTRRGMVGVDSAGRPMTNIFDIARERKKKVGVISTVAVVDATPAAFVAHVSHRRTYDSIAAQYMENMPDVVIGGGRKFFDRYIIPTSPSYRRLWRKGYQIVTQPAQIPTAYRKRLLALVAEVDLPSVEKRGNFLLDSWQTAHRLLSKGRHGYVLMLEGGQIDRACHARNPEWYRREIVDFLNVVNAVVNQAEKDGETLVLVLADHETGGLAITGGDLSTGTAELQWTTHHHTADLIPVFAYGPGSALFRGVYDNTDIFRKLRLLIEGK